MTPHCLGELQKQQIGSRGSQEVDKTTPWKKPFHVYITESPTIAVPFAYGGLLTALGMYLQSMECCICHRL